MDMLKVREPDSDLVFGVAVSVEEDHFDTGDVNGKLVFESVGRLEKRHRSDIERRSERLRAAKSHSIKC